MSRKPQGLLVLLATTFFVAAGSQDARAQLTINNIKDGVKRVTKNTPFDPNTYRLKIPRSGQSTLSVTSPPYMFF